MPSDAVFSPDLYYTSVLAIDLDDLRAAGVRALLLDLDNTLLPRDTNVVPEDTKDWAGRVHAAGFEVCLVSNNWHERVKAVADELGFRLVDKALKPLPFAFRRALSACGCYASEAAVIGDQVFTDILGGRFLGMTTVLVQPLSRTDLPHTLMLRHLESLVLKGRGPLA
jgi:uncharacterized protein